jgi:hypothetical protein
VSAAGLARRAVALCCLLLASAGGARAQAGAADAAAADTAGGGALRIFVVTYGPGEQVWERFGHDAIVVEDRATGESVSYNYGMFDFRQENFVLRFARGQMLYWMQGIPSAWYDRTYVRADRSIWRQELNLTPAQRVELKRFLEWNALEENKYYAYDYFRDNCATRVRDALDRVLGGRIRAATDTIPTPYSYRWHTRRLVAAQPLIYTGISLGLGRPTDRPITAWEEMFLPLELQERLRAITVTGPDGSPQPLVLAEDTVYTSRSFADRPAPPRWWPAYLAMGAVIGWMLARLGRAARARGPRRAFGTLGAAVAFLLGVGGVVLAGLWGLTDHRASYANENVLLLNLLALPLAILIPQAAAGSPWAARSARTLAGVVAGLAAAAILVKVLPGHDQRNAEMIALILPIHLGMLVGIRAMTAAAGPPPTAP